MELQWIFLILAAAVLVFGMATVVLNRRRQGSLEAPARRAVRAIR